MEVNAQITQEKEHEVPVIKKHLNKFSNDFTSSPLKFRTEANNTPVKFALSARGIKNSDENSLGLCGQNDHHVSEIQSRQVYLIIQKQFRQVKSSHQLRQESQTQDYTNTQTSKNFRQGSNLKTNRRKSSQDFQLTKLKVKVKCDLPLVSKK